MVLDGEWGTGKSVFAAQWAGLLRNQGHEVVYLDAFECDAHDDAFFALFAPIYRSISSDDQVRKLVVNAGLELLRTVAGNAGIPLAGAILDHITTTKGADDVLQARLNRVEQEASAISEFRKALAKACQSMTQRPELPDGDDANPRLIFLIDELDRCRPTFALSVLERMKHIFNAEEICFVLVTHLKELAAMVKHAYGLEEPERYLEKFYHLRIDFAHLRESGSTSDKANVRDKYHNYLCERFDLPREYDELTSLTIRNLNETKQPSLRSQERATVNLFLYDSAGRCAAIPDMLKFAAALCMMRCVDFELYRMAAKGQMTYENVNPFLELDRWNSSDEERRDIEAWWRLVTNEGEDGASPEVKRRMNAIAKDSERFRYAEGRAPLARRTAAEVRETAVVDICGDIDLFWQERGYNRV